jgi:uroporphyrinogen decarboxylase
MSHQEWTSLPREQVIRAVERNNPERIPLVMAKWWGEGLHEQYGDRLNEFDKYPDDVGMVMMNPLDIESMGLSWKIETGGAYDARFVIPEWECLDEFIEKMPDAEDDPGFDEMAEQIAEFRARDLYILWGWWSLFFERPWSLRGMENLMVDYYEEPENIHRLHDALATRYVGLIRRAQREFNPDGFWTSDDLGHQTQPMMRPSTFDELIKPYYDRVGDALREADIHWWLHSCGNNTELLPALIDSGVTVFHPVQKHTMDEKAVVEEFGDRLTFLAGFDVQHIIQEGTPDDVRKEVRFLVDTFDQADGGMCIAAGNGIVSGTPFENIDAFLSEALSYGKEHRTRMNS